MALIGRGEGVVRKRGLWVCTIKSLLRPGARPEGHLDSTQGNQCSNFILSATVGALLTVTSPGTWLICSLEVPAKKRKKKGRERFSRVKMWLNKLWSGGCYSVWLRAATVSQKKIFYLDLCVVSSAQFKKKNGSPLPIKWDEMATKVLFFYLALVFLLEPAVRAE